MEKLSLIILAVLIWSCQKSTPSEQTSSVIENDSLLTIYETKGREISKATFEVLSKHLQTALQEGGVSEAVKYCNIAAFPLTDSLSRVHSAQIRRTSLKVRNPENMPTEAEQAVLNQFAEMKKEGAEILPVVEKISPDEYTFYAPISVNSLCLQCHGKVGESLKAEDNKLIRQLYPKDPATGYTVGDLRGIWSITFHHSGNL